MEWLKYPPPNDKKFGNAKLCYFISCPSSELPIRDYKYLKKLEPHYEKKSYNEHASCNQRGIKNAYNRGISYLIFYTRYEGKEKKYKNRYFITGLFPISAWKKINERNAYLSDNPIFLSIDDSIELNDKRWRKWFKEELPVNNRGSLNLRYMAKFINKNSLALRYILKYFRNNYHKNKINEYINEIKREFYR